MSSVASPGFSLSGVRRRERISFLRQSGDGVFPRIKKKKGLEESSQIKGPSCCPHSLSRPDAPSEERGYFFGASPETQTDSDGREQHK